MKPRVVQVGERDILTPEIILALTCMLGLGAVILELNRTDYSRGCIQTENGKRFWLDDGRAVDISVVGEGGTIASLTSQPDPDRPDPL